VTVVAQDGSILLLRLSGPVASLVSGLGLESVATPVGSVVATLGSNV
jgi:hypothetical protein